MQKNEFETMVKELLPAVTEQAMEKMDAVCAGAGAGRHGKGM